MATPYRTIYSAALGKITEYEFSNMSEEDIDERMHDYLMSAISRFYLSCIFDLSDKNEITQEFNEDLTFIEIDILSELIVEQWLKTKLYASDLMKNHLNTKDFNLYSSANLLNAIRDTYDNVHKKTETMINRYSFNHADFAGLKKNES